MSLFNSVSVRSMKVIAGNVVLPQKTKIIVSRVLMTYLLGLFNVCDKFLVAFSVLLELREAFKRGVPISVAIESKLDAWCKQIAEVITQKLKSLNTLLFKRLQDLQNWKMTDN